MTKQELRNVVAKRLDDTIKKLNSVLAGKGIKDVEPILSRLGRGRELPHWFAQLKKRQSLPNLDGKTIGSVVEMLLVSVLELFTLKDCKIGELKINPARGVDIPDLDLGIKSPSENFCTSEPFFSAYERLLGNEHDIVVLLTDYQETKKKPPLRVSIIKWAYLKGTEVADKNLCMLARKHRDWLLQKNESYAKKVFKFLSYVNQSDWRAKQLVQLLDIMDQDARIKEMVIEIEKDYKAKNKILTKEGKDLIPAQEIQAIKEILEVKPLFLGVINAADNWVIETHKDFGRYPNNNEWERLKNGPLDGKIGMSFALQWRYNFGPLFRDSSE